MNLDESLQCVRPVIFENDGSEYPDSVECSFYRMQGTCFLIGHQQTTFVVMAQHVLTNQVSEGSDATYLHDQLRILYREGSRDFIPLGTCLYIMGDDKNYKDLLVLRVASGILDQTQRFNMMVLQVDNLELAMKTRLPIQPNAPLITRGYPAQFNYIDFEQRRIRLRATDLKGRLTGYNGNQHRFRMSWDPDDVSRIEKNCEEWIVGGHSWGPNLAIAYAVEFPERVLGVLGISGGVIHKDKAWSDQYNRRSKAGEECVPDFDYPPNMEVNKAVNTSWREYVRKPDILRRISNSQVPSIFVFGGSDIRPSWPVEQLASLMPRGSFVSIPGASHAIWLTHDGELRSHIREFIRLVTATR